MPDMITISLLRFSLQLREAGMSTFCQEQKQQENFSNAKKKKRDNTRFFCIVMFIIFFNLRGVGELGTFSRFISLSTLILNRKISHQIFTLSGLSGQK